MNSPTAQGQDPESFRIGRQIRDLRRAKSVTLQSMAKTVGRSVGYLSQVERGVSALPVPVLQSISEVLGVQITWFFHSDVEQPLEELGHIVRAASRRQLNFSGTGIHEELLSPKLSGQLLMIKTTFLPLAETDQQQRKRQGEEAVYLSTGKIQLSIGKRMFELSEGDSFSMNSDESYRVFNPSETQKATMIWVITPPNY